MITINEVEEIIGLINEGYNLKLISFELDIPIEQLNQYKLELENTKQTKVVPAKRISKQESNKEIKELSEIKRKYNKLYFGEKVYKDNKQNELKPNEIEHINNKIENIQKLVEKVNNNISQEQRIKDMKKIVIQLQSMKQLSINQSKQIIELLLSIKFTAIDLEQKARRCRYKQNILNGIIENVDNCQNQTEDLEELRNLKRRLTPEIKKENYTFATSVEYKINNKIFQIEKNKCYNNIRNNIPFEIEQIIKDLANGTLDDKKANEIIDIEASKQVQNNKNKFGKTTKEQKVNQIVYQIKTNLAKRVDKYKIINPERTIMQIQKICNGQINPAIKTVVEHLITSKDFDKAKKLCDKFLENDKDNPNILALQKEIKNAEIGDLVLKTIHMNIGDEEQIKYFRKVKKAVESKKIKPAYIPLGKSYDGQRKITLADILEKQIIRE